MKHAYKRMCAMFSDCSEPLVIRVELKIVCIQARRYEVHILV